MAAPEQPAPRSWGLTVFVINFACMYDYLDNNFDAFNADDYDTAQTMCNVLWHEVPVVDNDDTVLGYCTIDGEGYYW